MINAETQEKSTSNKNLTIFKSDLFSKKVIQTRPIFFVAFVIGLIGIFYLAILNPEIIFSIITGLALFLSGFVISNLIYLNASGKKEDAYNRTIIKNTTDIFLIFQIKAGRFKYVSPSIKRILGYDLSSVINQYDISFVHPADRFELYNILDTNFLRLNRMFTSTIRMIKRDGTICWVEIKGDVLVDASNELENVVMNLRDVTKQKEEQIALEQYQKSLEQSIQRNNTKTHEYEEIADLMSSFDLKEPLRTISSYSQLIQHRYSKKLDKDGNEFLQFTIDGADRMARMMEDILSFSNIRLDKLKPRVINSEKAIREVQHVLNQPLKKYKAEVTYDELPKLKVDFIQFKQLLKNLIENSLKFRSDKNPRVKISSEELEKDWLFKVEDNGIGISPDYHDSIFNVFGKIKGMGRPDGSGVGLAVCKKIVTNHGGKIWVESSGNGEGSTFYFTIPKAIEENNNNICTKQQFQPELTFKKLKLQN